MNIGTLIMNRNMLEKNVPWKFPGQNECWKNDVYNKIQKKKKDIDMDNEKRQKKEIDGIPLEK